MTDHLINQCKQIKQNSEYNAGTHSTMAKAFGTLGWLVQVIPAAYTAVSASINAAKGNPPMDSWTTASAIATAVATVMNPGRIAEGHRDAARHFTILKHDARALHEAFRYSMDENVFYTKVEQLHQRYNDAIRISPITSDWAFMYTRWKIKLGLHKPDRNNEGEID